jgi:protoporphyrinogen oxidase
LNRQRAVIIGAGPAGLTAAYELLTRGAIQPVVLEKSDCVGGIAQTHNYKGNRIDLGGHRFFSKSDRIMRWWLDRLPVEATSPEALSLSYQGASRLVPGSPEGPDPAREDRVMLVRQRKSRIYFLRRFFDYPIRLTPDTLVKLGAVRTLRIGFSYLRSVLFPLRKVENLEQFFISRFGRELYRTFFQSYTEKVWGVSCREISAEWGAQRIKGVSVGRSIAHALKHSFHARRADLAQKDVETSLIGQFLYPKYGPGQMWETVAHDVDQMGGQVLTGWNVESIAVRQNRIVSVTAHHSSGETRVFEGDYFFSTMPVPELLHALTDPPPADVLEIGDGLVYRDFITVGLLLNQLKVRDPGVKAKLIADNWIYIQEPDVLAGRLQIFNNWSPYLVADPSKVWVGVEYFCREGDDLWRRQGAEMAALAAAELDRIGIIDRNDVIDSTVLRMPKTYPAYFGTYSRFNRIREFLDGFANLYLVGRNGMHKYNNQDHSMLTAMIAVDNILAGRSDKSNIWDVNTELEYHESQNHQPAKAGIGEAVKSP